MKRLFQVIIVSTIFVVSACDVYPQGSPQRTSGARAAYGSAVPDFKAHQKKSKKIKEKARKNAKRKHMRNNSSYWHRRPY